MATVLTILIVVLLVRWLFLRHAIQELRNQVNELTSRSVTSSELADLTRRVHALEGIPVAPAPRPEPVATLEPALDPAPEPEPLPMFQPPVETLSWSDRLRTLFGTDEWEALIGVSLLNKLGALLFVIGLAFALSYSFEHTTAAGRAAIAFASSVAVLIAGVWVERRQRYQVFARGLIGAGWAGLYATSYAVWALPQARVIQNPFLGSLGMLAVAAGMIAHSLRYRAQAVTAVAYFAAFAALAATPSNPFAVVSLIPLAASLLYLAARFQWHSMALFGLAATYLTCISRGQSDAPLVSTETLFLTYWLLFEGFDLIRVARRIPSHGLDALFPLNTAAFLWLSYLTWSHHRPGDLWLASAFAAALFLADALARGFLRPPSTFDADADLLTRLRAGSYEGAVVVAAILAGLAIVGRVPGVWTSIGIALEAEMVYLAGVWLASPFLRGFAGRAFILSLARLFWTGDPWSRSTVLDHATWNWTPPLLFHAALFYVNRALRQPNAIFSSAAAFAIVVVIAAETPHAFIGTLWLIVGMLLFELGNRRDQNDFRLQSYVVLIAGVLTTALYNLGHGGDWRPLALSLAIAYSSALRHRVLAVSGAAATALLAMLLLWAALPISYVAASWFALAVLLFEIGNRRLPVELRLTSEPVLGFAWFALLATHLDDFAKFPPNPARISWFVACAACWALAARLKSTFAYIPAILGSVAALAGLWLVVPNPWVALTWTLLAFAMLSLGTIRNLAWLRSISCGTAGLAFIAALIADIEPAQLFVSIPIVAILYAAQFTARRSAETQPPILFSLFATLLWSALLYGKVSGGLLTVSWGFEGLLLLGAGFLLRERLLRLQGLVLLMVCILKLFLYDMRNLETLYRILSFVALGLILLCVSWIYSRFREHMKKLL